MTDYVPYVIVMVGLPGSGKSTFASFVDEPEFGDTVFVYSTDDYIEKFAAVTSTTYNAVFRDVIDDATKAMNARLELALAHGYSVLWDQTNMSSKKRKSILSKFPRSYKKECWCIQPPQAPEDWAELDRRLASREGKMIPHHIVEAMANSYVEPDLDEGFDKITIVDMYGKILKQKGN